MFGVFALPLIILSFLAGILIFHAMKTLFKVPGILNLPGAFGFAGATFIFVSQVLEKIGVFKQSLSFAPELLILDIPWYTSLAYLGISVIYYATIIRFLFIWRTDKKTRQKVGIN